MCEVSLCIGCSWNESRRGGGSWRKIVDHIRGIGSPSPEVREYCTDNDFL